MEIRQNAPKPYLLFDSGGTLLFPDQVFLNQIAKAHGIELTQEQLYTGYYELIYTLDFQSYKTAYAFSYNPWPHGYALTLLKSMGFQGEAVNRINQAVQARHSRKSLWTFTFDWISQTLKILTRQGYSMSVISNSQDSTRDIFSKVDLACYFEHIFHSAELGVEKPDPRIFEKVLRELNLRPPEVLYIGDIFNADVRGANAAGIGGIHLDPLGKYSDWPGVHLADIRALPGWLTQYVHSPPRAFDLFPVEDPPRHQS
jgi:FMN phosphatase YigB (HAD superfamily)